MPTIAVIAPSRGKTNCQRCFPFSTQRWLMGFFHLALAKSTESWLPGQRQSTLQETGYSSEPSDCPWFINSHCERHDFYFLSQDKVLCGWISMWTETNQCLSMCYYFTLLVFIFQFLFTKEGNSFIYTVGQVNTSLEFTRIVLLAQLTTLFCLL